MDVDKHEDALRTLINLAAIRTNIPRLLQANTVERVVTLLSATDDIVCMLACWATNNFNVHGLAEVYAEFARLQAPAYFPRILELSSRDLLLKAMWAVINLTRDARLCQQFFQYGVHISLVQIMIDYYDDHEILNAALDPLYNMLYADPSLAKEFSSAGVMRSAVTTLLTSLDQEDVALSQKTLRILNSFAISTDELRRELIEEKILYPIYTILGTDSKTKAFDSLKALALVTVNNISLASDTDQPILVSGILIPCVDLLRSTHTSIVLNAASVLANLSSSAKIREALRQYGWTESILGLLLSTQISTRLADSIARFLCNVTLDEWCRQLLVESQGKRAIAVVYKRTKDTSHQFYLSQTSEHLNLPVSEDTLWEMEQYFNPPDWTEEEHSPEPKPAYNIVLTSMAPTPEISPSSSSTVTQGPRSTPYTPKRAASAGNLKSRIVSPEASRQDNRQQQHHKQQQRVSSMIPATVSIGYAPKKPNPMTRVLPYQTPSQRGRRENKLPPVPTVRLTDRPSESPPPMVPRPSLVLAASATKRVASETKPPPRKQTLPIPSDSEPNRSRKTTRHFVPADGQAELRREHIAREILDTESSYVDSLQLMFELLIDEAYHYLEPEQIKITFRGLMEIKRINSAFLGTLKERISGWNATTALHDIFAPLSKDLHKYSDFIDHYPEAMAKYQEIVTTNERYREYVAELAGRRIPSVQVPRLAAHFFIMPVQRIPRYILLLEDLVENSPESHPDKTLLPPILASIKQIAQDINESKAAVEDASKLAELASKLIDYPEQLFKSRPKIVYEGDLIRRTMKRTKYKNELVHIVVLSNMILETQQRRRNLSFVRAIWLKQISSVTLSEDEDDAKRSKYVFRLHHVQDADTILLCESDVSRALWVHHVEKALSDQKA